MTASWSGPIRVQPNTSVVRAIDRGQWQAPLGSSHGQPPDHRQPAAVLVRQGQAFGGAEEAPSLTAAAPRRRWKYAVGTEECSRRGSNKRMECKGRPKWRDAPLTMKAPYKPDAETWRRVDRVALTLARLIGRRMAREDFEALSAANDSRP